MLIYAIVAALVALAAGAGSINDSDSDLVPDVFDNCSADANGPGDPLNQTDTDGDGFGDSCDCDYNNTGIMLIDDIAELFGAFNTASPLHDNTGDGLVLLNDVAFCFGAVGQSPGPGATAFP